MLRELFMKTAPAIIPCRVDFGVSEMSVCDLDDIAVTNNSLVGELTGLPNTIRADVEDLRIGDWKFMWIATRGRLDHGKLILLPQSRRTKRLAILGRVRFIARRFKVRQTVALRVARCMYGLRNAHEIRVMALATKSYQDEMWSSAPYPVTDQWRDAACTIWGEKYPELKFLSTCKLAVVQEIVQRLREDPSGKAFAALL